MEVPAIGAGRVGVRVGVVHGIGVDRVGVCVLAGEARVIGADHDVAGRFSDRLE